MKQITIDLIIAKRKDVEAYQSAPTPMHQVFLDGYNDALADVIEIIDIHEDINQNK